MVAIDSVVAFATSAEIPARARFMSKKRIVFPDNIVAGAAKVTVVTFGANQPVISIPTGKDVAATLTE